MIVARGVGEMDCWGTRVLVGEGGGGLKGVGRDLFSC